MMVITLEGRYELTHTHAHIGSCSVSSFDTLFSCDFRFYSNELLSVTMAIFRIASCHYQSYTSKTNQFTGEFRMYLFLLVLLFFHVISFFAPTSSVLLIARQGKHTKKDTSQSNERMERQRKKKLTNTYVARVFLVSQTIT